MPPCSPSRWAPPSGRSGHVPPQTTGFFDSVHHHGGRCGSVPAAAARLQKKVPKPPRRSDVRSTEQPTRSRASATLRRRLPRVPRFNMSELPRIQRATTHRRRVRASVLLLFNTRIPHPFAAESGLEASWLLLRGVRRGFTFVTRGPSRASCSIRRERPRGHGAGLHRVHRWGMGLLYKSPSTCSHARGGGAFWASAWARCRRADWRWPCASPRRRRLSLAGNSHVLHPAGRWAWAWENYSFWGWCSPCSDTAHELFGNTSPTWLLRRWQSTW